MKTKDDIWPLVIIKARYGGVYEGAKFVAFMADPATVDDAYGGDLECEEFFLAWTLPIGRGETPDEAVSSLWASIQEKDTERIR